MNTEMFKAGDAVRILSGAKLANGKNAAAWIFETKLFVLNVENDEVIVSKNANGSVLGTFKLADVVDWVDEPVVEENFESYVILTTKETVVYTGPGIKFKRMNKYDKNRLLTVIGEKDGFGKLKLGGWVNLSEVIKR